STVHFQSNGQFDRYCDINILNNSIAYIFWPSPSQLPSLPNFLSVQIAIHPISRAMSTPNGKGKRKVAALSSSETTTTTITTVTTVTTAPKRQRATKRRERRARNSRRPLSAALTDAWLQRFKFNLNTSMRVIHGDAGRVDVEHYKITRMLSPRSPSAFHITSLRISTIVTRLVSI
ncbi:hypothetical protein EDD21DRAFT_381375, partial [Dissophora ornata]